MGVADDINIKERLGNARNVQVRRVLIVGIRVLDGVNSIGQADILIDIGLRKEKKTAVLGLGIVDDVIYKVLQITNVHNILGVGVVGAATTLQNEGRHVRRVLRLHVGLIMIQRIVIIPTYLTVLDEGRIGIDTCIFVYVLETV